jgi:hypothetical protein
MGKKKNKKEQNNEEQDATVQDELLNDLDTEIEIEI